MSSMWRAAIFIPALLAAVSSASGQYGAPYNYSPVPTYTTSSVSYAIADWRRLRQSNGYRFADYARFLIANPDWPEESKMRLWAEKAMVPGENPATVIAFFAADKPRTGNGWARLADAYASRSQSAEARVILGAAVIDDVLGLVILAVVAGAIGAADRGGALSSADIGLTLGKAVVFLFGALILGVYLSPRVFNLASRLSGQGVLLVTALVFCFVLAYVSSIIGLAPIVGAYAAGLILEDAHFRPFANRGELQLEHLVHPLSTFLVPVFFVVMGMRVDLRAFARMDVVGLAALLTLAAMVGKQACAIGAIGRPLDRLSIGIGMMPRGEVGLIFANIGLGLTLAGEPIVDQAIFSAVVIMVIVTTMATPPLLKWSLARRA